MRHINRSKPQRPRPDIERIFVLVIWQENVIQGVRIRFDAYFHEVWLFTLLSKPIETGVGGFHLGQIFHTSYFSTLYLLSSRRYLHLHTIIFLSRIAGQFVYIQRDNLISIFKSTPRSIGIYTAITFIDGSRKQTNDISNSYVAYSACPYGRQ